MKTKIKNQKPEELKKSSKKNKPSFKYRREVNLYELHDSETNRSYWIKGKGIKLIRTKNYRS